MPASRETRKQIIAAIFEWTDSFSIPEYAISILLQKLEKVEGNQSFTKTISDLKKEYDKIIGEI